MNSNTIFSISGLAQRCLSNTLVRTSFLAFFLLMVLPAQATHIVGGELYYKCLGNNEYEITLTIYRDCLTGVADFDDPASIGVFDGITDQLVQDERLDFNPLINDTLDIEEINPCLEIQGDVCIHRTIYTKTISLPFRNGGYTLAYQRCCRNEAIVNIVQPVETGATYVARVTEEALLSCDNSPVFTNWPPVFICVNRPIDFDHAATDADGDSLVYRMCTPYSGATRDIPKPQPPNPPSGTEYDNVQYIGQYNEGNMLGNVLDPLTIDSETGFLTGTPTIMGQFVVGICVDEYRDGVLISTTRRDFQYIVGECVEITSQIGNPNIQCDDLEVAFDNTSLDANNFVWNFGDPTNPNATSTEVDPTYIYPDTGTYIVTLISEPNDACTDTLEFVLNLKTATINPDFSTFLLKCTNGIEIVTENASTDPVHNIVSYLWTLSDLNGNTIEVANGANPVFTYVGTEDVQLTVAVSSTDGCTRSATQLVDVTGFNAETGVETITACAGDVVNLFPDGPDFSTINYQWTPATGLSNATTVNPSVTATTTDMTYTLVISADNSDCFVDFDKIVDVSDIVDVDLDATVTSATDGSTTTITDTNTVLTCEGETVTLTSTDVTTNITTYAWTDANGNSITPDANGDITVNPDESTTYTVVVTDENGCTGTDQFTVDPSGVNVQVDELTNITTGGGGINDLTGDGVLDLCPGQIGSLNVTNLDAGPLDYAWTDPNGLITAGGFSSNPTITAGQNAGVFTLTVTATNANGCTTDIAVPIEIHEIGPIDISATVTDVTTNTTTMITGVDEINVCGDEQAILTITSTTALTNDVSYTWYDSNGVNVGTDGDLLSICANGEETYTIIATNAAGCTAESSITVNCAPVNILIEETDNDPTTGSGLTDTNGDGTLDLCLGSTSSLTLVNLDNTDVNTYVWSGDTQILTSTSSQTPIIDYDQAGIYTLSVEATNQFGCSETMTVLIEIQDLGPIDINADVTDVTTNTTTNLTGLDQINICGDEQAVLTLTSTTAITNDLTYTWYNSAGINVEENGDLLVTNPNSEETYTLIATNGVGCTAETTITVTGSMVDILIEETDNDFTNGSGLTDLNNDGILDLCLGSTSSLTLVNLDNTDVNTYVWSGDTQILGSTSSQTPTISHDQAGVYTVTVEATNQFDCSETMTVVIEIHEEPVIDITATLTDIETNTQTVVTGQDLITSCDEGAIVLTTENITATTGASYTWTDADGNPIGTGEAITVNPDGSTTYTLEVTNTFGCSAITEITVEGSPVDITVVQTATDADGNGFPDTDLNGDGTLDLCPNENFTLQVTNNAVGQTLTYNWTADASINVFGGTTATPAIEPTQAGNYNVYLETTNQYGCIATETIPVTVLSPIVPIVIDQSQECIGFTMNFTANNPNFEYYTWNFGDGETLTGVQSPSHTYNSAGNYNVTFSPIAGLTCGTQTNTQAITVDDSIVDIEFDYTYVDCGPDGVTLQFSDESSTSQGSITAWNWTFSDGQTSNEQNPTISLANNGTLTATLTVTNEDNCEGSNVEALAINFTTPIEFPADLVSCFGDEPIALNPNANPDYTYAWSNGLTGANPSVDPAQTTTYQVTITDNTGAALCQLEQEVTITVGEDLGLTLDATGTVSGPFTLDATSDTNTITTCEDEQIMITTNTAVGVATDYTYAWDPLITGTSEITLDLDGSTTHTVTITDDLGCTDVTSITVQGGPVDIEIEQTTVSSSTGEGNAAVFNADGTIDLCLGTSFTLNVNNLDANDQLTYNWTGDDILEAGTENTANPVLNPSAPGVYTLYLETTNQFDCVELDTIPVTVVDPNTPLAFESVKDCDGVSFNFTNLGDAAFDYVWSFGDGTPTVSTQDATHTYTAVGDYDVTLEIVANVACVAPAVEQESVFDPILAAGFDYDYVACGPDGITVEFTDQSENPDNNTTEIVWEINGQSYTGETVAVTFDENTAFDVTQTVFTALGCETSLIENDLAVELTETIDFSTIDNTHCQNNGEVELNPTGNTNFTYAWSPAEGLSCSDCPNPTADPTSTTTYSVTITNNAGILPCTAVQEITLTVPTEINLDFTDDFVTDCVDEATLTVTANVDGLTYEWFAGDPSTPSISAETTVDVMPSGPVVYTVIATDSNGCTEEEAITVTGTGLQVSMDDLQYFCQDGLGQIIVTNADPNDMLTYEWEGEGIIQNDGSMIFIETMEPIESEYTVTVTNQYGCSTEETITAIVLGEPLQPTTGQCDGLTVNFVNSDDPNAAYYIWDFGDNFATMVAGPNPTYTYDQLGSYIVTLSLPNGADCFEAAVFDLNITEDALLANYAEVFDADCADIASITLNDNSTSGNQGTITSWLWDLGDNGTFTDQNPSFEMEDSGMVSGTLTITTDAGCVQTTAVNFPVDIVNEQVSIDNITDCIDFEATLNPNPVDGYTYTWADFDATSPTIVVNGNAAYMVTITNEDQACTAVQTVNASNHDVLGLTTGDDISECENLEVAISASSELSGINYTWTDADGTEVGTGSSIPVNTGNGLGPITYYVTAADVNGCTEMDSVTVENNAVFIDYSLLDDVSCAPGDNIMAVQEVILQGSTDQDLTYAWEGPAGTISDASVPSPVFSPMETTTYNVLITNNAMPQCSTTQEVTISVSNINSDIDGTITSSENEIYLGNSVDMNVALGTGDYTFDWDGDGIPDTQMADPNVNATPIDLGEVPYLVTVTDEETGCTTTENITITVLGRTCAEPFIYFPNAFSPNMDGENEVLRLRYNPAHVTDASWAVYNRWGQKVFETNDLKGEWDGTFEGQPVSPDVYGFWLRTTCADGEEFHKQGNVTVLK